MQYIRFHVNFTERHLHASLLLFLSQNSLFVCYVEYPIWVLTRRITRFETFLSFMHNSFILFFIIGGVKSIKKLYYDLVV